MGTFVDKVPTEPFAYGTEVYSGTGSEDAKSLVTAKFNNSLENSELMLDKLLGADGNSGYLGQLNTLLSGPLTWAEVSPDNSVFPTLLSRLLTDLSSGATGLDATVEAEIIARAQARQDVLDDKQEQETLEFFSSRGFERPTGAMQAAIAELANERARNRTELNGKTMIMQAELAQKNSQFIIGMAKEFESILREFANKVNDRALNYATAIAGLREKIAEAMANIGMQSVASWAGSFHANAGLSHSTGRHQSESHSHSESRSASFSVGNSLSESHQYKEE